MPTSFISTPRTTWSIVWFAFMSARIAAEGRRSWAIFHGMGGDEKSKGPRSRKIGARRPALAAFSSPYRAAIPSHRKLQLQPSAISSNQTGSDFGLCSQLPAIEKQRCAAEYVLRISAQSADNDDQQDRSIRSWIKTVQAPESPASWAELGRNAALLGREAITQALDDQLLQVPSIEGSSGAKCQLTTDSQCRRFRSEKVNCFLVDLFLHIAQHPDLPDFALNRFDLFHAHIFLGRGTNRLGLLFHAQEYPAFDADKFPLFLGFCQANSSLVYEESRMRFRNILWWDDALHVLDVSSSSPLSDSLVLEGLGDPVFTVDEAAFGDRLIDITYFHSLSQLPHTDRLFVC